MSDNESVREGQTEAIYKIIVIGDSAVGKSELIAKFATFSFEENYLPILGVSILKEPIELQDYNAKVNLLFWNIAGFKSQFYMLRNQYFSGADGMLLVFDITRSYTFSKINNWYNLAVKYGLSGIPRILIGNKAHLTEERKIILPMVETLAEKLNASYYETSTLSGVNFKEAFEKIAELVLRLKESNDTWNTEPLTFKAYEGPTQTLSQSKLVKKEKRALETTFRYFNESKVAYYKPEKSKTDLLSAIETGDLVVLTSKWKYPKIFDFFTWFIIIFMVWWLLLVLPGAIIADIIITIILIGYTGRFITFAIYFRHYYILLDSQGIYYKKIGSPRFISWDDVVLISSYFEHYTFSSLHHNERAIGLKLKSKKIVRFKEINYQFKYKVLMFEDTFRTFKFRRCPFYRLGRHRGQFSYE